MIIERQPSAEEPWSVLWTRGRGCAELADLLSAGTAVRVSGDLLETCIRSRADLLVSRRSLSNPVVSGAVPHDFDAERVRQVVGAVGGGPHSLLGARVAGVLSQRLGVPAELVSVSRSEDEGWQAVSALRRIGRDTGLPTRSLSADRASALFGELPEGSLVVLGAPGGSLLQRLFFGPGVRLRAKAPAGAVVVQTAPRRVFQVMDEPEGVSPHLRAADARRLVHWPSVPVVEEGELIGTFRPPADCGPSLTVRDLMEPARSVPADAPLSDVPLGDEGPLAVVDRRGRLIGTIRAEQLRA